MALLRNKRRRHPCKILAWELPSLTEIHDYSDDCQAFELRGVFAWGQLLQRIAITAIQHLPSICLFLVFFFCHKFHHFTCYFLADSCSLHLSTAGLCLSSSRSLVFTLFLWRPSAFLFPKCQHCLSFHAEIASPIQYPFLDGPHPQYHNQDYLHIPCSLISRASFNLKFYRLDYNLIMFVLFANSQTTVCVNVNHWPNSQCYWAYN